MINDFLSRLPGFKRDVIYDLLAYQNLNLCLDVGAAAGGITRRLKQIGDDDTRVIGFEPFVGNHQYFVQNTQSFANVELVKKAAAATTGKSTFRVLSTVEGSEKGWEKYLGYSSTGYLVDEEASNELRNRNPKMQELHVDTVAIDDLVDEHVDFLKIDVQGGEYGVLKGCERVITNHGIDVMYVEFDGDRRILEYLNSLEYTIFDTDYLLVVFKLDPEPLAAIGFYDFEILNLSVGRQAYRAKLSLSDENYCDFFKHFKAQKLGYAFTDLICVSKPFLTTFIENVLHYTKAQGLDFDQDNYSLAATQRPVEKRLTAPISAPQEPIAQQKIEAQSQPNIQVEGSPPTASVSPSMKVEDNENKQANKKSERASKISQIDNQNLVESEPSQRNALGKTNADYEASSDSSIERASSLIKRIAAYYRRWPIGLAGLAIACDLIAYADVPFRGVFTLLSVIAILLLIGHAASKADRLLVDVDALKEQQLQLDKKISKYQKRTKKKQHNNS